MHPTTPITRTVRWIALAALVAAPCAAQDESDLEKRLLLARAANDVDAARVQLDIAQESLAHAGELHARGFVTATDLAEGRRRRAAAEHALQVATSRRAEIEATGRTPDDRLAAPIVGERDFVGERLVHTLEVARAAATVQEQRIAQVKELHGRGFVGDGDLRAAVAELEGLHGRARSLEQKRELRARFLRGEIPGGELALRARRLDLEVSLADLQRERELQEHRVAKTHDLRAKDYVGGNDLREDELELRRLAREIRATELEITSVEGQLKQ